TQLLWFKKIRKSAIALFFISFLIQIGMWLERFWLVLDSTAHDFIPATRRTYYGTFWDYSMFAATIGFFLLMFLLYMRSFPSVATSETRELAFSEGELGDPAEGLKPEEVR